MKQLGTIQKKHQCDNCDANNRAVQPFTYRNNKLALCQPCRKIAQRITIADSEAIQVVAEQLRKAAS